MLDIAVYTTRRSGTLNLTNLLYARRLLILIAMAHVGKALTPSKFFPSLQQCTHQRPDALVLAWPIRQANEVRGR